MAPLSFAAAGVATDVALNKAEQVADNLVQQSGAVASLTSSKIARDLQILISDARQQMHEELTYSWGTLDRKKVDLLRSIDDDIGQLNGVMAKGGLLEEDAYLDLTQLMSTLPFAAPDPILRSVEGSTLTYHDTGTYRVVMRGTIFNNQMEPPTFELGKTAVGREVKVAYSPYEAAMDIPQSSLAQYFKGAVLSYVPVTVKVQVWDRSYWFPETRNKKRTATYTFTLQLLPEHPISRYSLTEMNEEPTVDHNVVKTDWSEIVSVPGCGHDDCNSVQPICADVPAGAEPITIVDHYDSLANAWGNFDGPPRVTGGTTCQDFHQHRPALRNVKIKISYYPPDSTLIANDVRLHEVSVEETAKTPVPAANDLSFDRLYVAYFGNKMKSLRLAMILFTGEPLSSTPEKTSSPLLEISRSDESKVKEITIKIKTPW